MIYLTYFVLSSNWSNLSSLHSSSVSQELPVKVQEVIGLYVPPSPDDETSPESESHETQQLLSQSQAEATETSQSSNSTAAAARPRPTYP